MPDWHVFVIGLFAVSATVYVLSHFNDEMGWIYVIILLLGMMLAIKSFGTELAGFFGNVNPPTRIPGQTGPY
jgi:hypothetical protein